MRKHRITEADASALVTGRPPGSRPELEDLAMSLAEFRAASFETLPRPSAELASRLDFANATTGISVLNEAAQNAATIETTVSAGTARVRRRGWAVRVFTWFAGLGLAFKILLGTAVVAAAATGVGAAGALPPVVQDVFDEVVSTVVSTDESDDESEGSDDAVTDETGGSDDAADDSTDGYDPESGNFGSWVSEQAKDKDGTGHDFGKMVSGEAHNKPHGGSSGDDSGEDVGDDSGDDGDTTGDAVDDDGSQVDGQHGGGGGPKKDSHK